MNLYFIRHGETTGDVENRYGGAYDDLLSPLGEQQVKELAGELASVGIEKIFASSLKRAQQTAAGLASRVGCPVVTLPDLRERDNNGPLAGLTRQEGLERFPDLVELVKDRLNTIPGAESYTDASQRMERGVDAAIRQTQNCSAIVWHGGGMRALFRDMLTMGELGKIGDCAWVHLEGPDRAHLQVRQAKRMTFEF